MGFYSGGLIIGSIFASEIWVVVVAALPPSLPPFFFFLEGGGGLIIGILRYADIIYIAYLMTAGLRFSRPVVSS